MRRHSPRGRGPRAWPASLLFWLAGAAVLPADPPPAAAPPPYLQILLDRADELSLHTNRYWHLLLHVRPHLGGPKSEIDDPAFFLAPDGKTNPRAELRATLAAFFADDGRPEEETALCRFVARFAWLSETLAIDPQELPCPPCTVFNDTMRQLDIASAALVFPAAFINGPASMFGHTLVVFDSRDKNRLLSRAVSYAALIQNNSGAAFAVGGLLGFYPGVYSILPYYDKVEQYNDLSHRDMWEYELDLDEQELMRMARHTWELQNIRSDYYFFTENCSYNLLYLLDAARPSLRLVDDFAWSWVIPIDTIKAVRQAGLIRRVDYRPSKATRVRRLADGAAPEIRAAALDIAAGRLDPDDALAPLSAPADRIRAADLAAEYIQYLYSRRLLPVEEYRPRLIGTLTTRSRLGQVDAPPHPEPAHPEDGHAPGRLSLGAGVREGDFFSSVEFRPVYHELGDRDDGYETGAQIQFFDLEARYIPEREDLQLQRLSVIDILSVSPRDEFFKVNSWMARGGFRVAPAPGNPDNLAGEIVTGGGLAVMPRGAGLLYALAAGAVRADDELDQALAAGPGAAAGWTRRMTPAWKTLLQGEAAYYLLGDDFGAYRVRCRQCVELGRDVGLSLEVNHEFNQHVDVTEGLVSLRWYL